MSIPSFLATPLTGPVVLRLLTETARSDAIVVVRVRAGHATLVVVGERPSVQVRRVPIPKEAPVPGKDLSWRLQTQVLDRHPARPRDSSKVTSSINNSGRRCPTAISTATVRTTVALACGATLRLSTEPNGGTTTTTVGIAAAVTVPKPTCA